MQDNCVQVAIQSATAAGRALCFTNNQLMSSSAHQHPVISLHNNPAASEMWQEAGAPKRKRLWGEGSKAVQTGCMKLEAPQPSQALMPYYCPQAEPKRTVLSAGTLLCLCHSPPLMK